MYLKGAGRWQENTGCNRQPIAPVWRANNSRSDGIGAERRRLTLKLISVMKAALLLLVIHKCFLFIITLNTCGTLVNFAAKMFLEHPWIQID